MNWTVVRLPAVTSRALGKRGQVRIQGTINGFPFRTTLFPDGTGGHFLIVNRTMQKGAAVTAGDTAKFDIREDSEPLVTVMPQELQTILDSERELKKYFRSLSPSMQRFIARGVGESKNKETRLRRADAATELLMLVMEGEKEPPPLLRSVFLRYPLAQSGWDKMPLSHKRGHLYGIFQSANPESRARRVERAVAMMLRYAKRRQSTEPEEEIGLRIIRKATSR